MVKNQQMRWNRHTVESFLDVRVHVLNDTWKMHFDIGTSVFSQSRVPHQVAVAV